MYNHTHVHVARMTTVVPGDFGGGGGGGGGGGEVNDLSVASHQLPPLTASRHNRGQTMTQLNLEMSRTLRYGRQTSYGRAGENWPRINSIRTG